MAKCEAIKIMATFNKIMIVSALTFLLSGCSSTGLRQKSIEPDGATHFPIIDAHIHTSFTNEPERLSLIPYSKERLLEEMKANNVVGAVSMMSRKGEGYSTDLIKQGIISCVGVTEQPNLKDVESGLKEGRYRCIKVYLGYVHQFAAHPRYRPLYRMAEKYKVPVVFHTGDTYSTQGKLKYSDPLTVDEVAVDYPNTTFVIAHCGNPWIQSAAEVAYKNPNVYLDGSAFMIGDLSRMSEEELNLSIIEPLRWVYRYVEDPSKILFGTDWPLTEMGAYLEVFKKAIPPEHWRKVFHDNAVQVFHLTQSND